MLASPARSLRGRVVPTILLITLLATLLLPARAGAQQSGNVLRNGDLEGNPVGISAYQSVGEGWSWFARPHTPGAPDWDMNPPDFVVKTNERRRSGSRSQEWYRRWSTYEAGIYQQAQVPVGAELTFSAFFYNISNTRDDATYSDSTIFARVGIDPNGGTDPFSPSVVWSEQGRTMQQWYELRVTTVARNSTVTVFALTRPEYAVTTNVSTVDDLSLTYLVTQPTPTPTPSETPTATPPPSDQPPATPSVEATPSDGSGDRLFPQTGFAITDDTIWDYFNRRGGVTTFGYPVSNRFLLDGFPVQIFQRLVVQIGPDGNARLLNLLDRDTFPITQINGSTIPGPDQALILSAPPATDAEAALRFVQENAPDVWEGLPVNFYQTFLNTVSFEQAFPDGNGDRALLPLIALEMWGLPTSPPALDPNNHNFVYMRWQRGVMHFDATTGLTQAMLLADYFKGILTGEHLPADVAAQAAGLKYFRQYSPGSPNGIARPSQLPNSNLLGAFEPGQPVAAQPGTPNPPASTAPPTPVAPPVASSGFGYGFQVHLLHFDQGSKQRTIDLIRNAGFNWVKHQVEWKIVETSPGQYNWGEFDAIADTASRSGVKVLFSVVQAPTFYQSPTSGHTPADPNTLRTFMQRMAEHFRGRVQAYEIWNEQNLDREVGPNNVNPANYVQLLKAGYQGVKAGDPGAIVVMGAPSLTGDIGNKLAVMDDVEYIQALYAVNGGEVKQYFDVLGAHPSGFGNPPDDVPGRETGRAPGWKGHPSFYAFYRMQQYRDVMVANGDGNKQIWFTEYGYDSTPNPPPGYEYAAYITEEEQAAYLRRAFEKARTETPWVGAMFVWNLNFQLVVGPGDEKWGFGVIRGDWSPRPAYNALAAMPKS